MGPTQAAPGLARHAALEERLRGRGEIAASLVAHALEHGPQAQLVGRVPVIGAFAGGHSDDRRGALGVPRHVVHTGSHGGVVASCDPCDAPLGTEGDGLAAAALAGVDVTVMISMQGGVDSLNVAAASAVAVWALVSGRPGGR